MKNKKWDFIVYPHIVLLLWALLFFGSIFIFDSGTVASVFALGTPLFLFFNIPFSVVSLVLKEKGYFSKRYGRSIVVLSILNIIVEIAAWYFAILLLQKP